LLWQEASSPRRTWILGFRIQLNSSMANANHVKNP
jgi:hypothetical protein